MVLMMITMKMEMLKMKIETMQMMINDCLILLQNVSFTPFRQLSTKQKAKTDQQDPSGADIWLSVEWMTACRSSTLMLFHSISSISSFSSPSSRDLLPPPPSSPRAPYSFLLFPPTPPLKFVMSEAGCILPQAAGNQEAEKSPHSF